MQHIHKGAPVLRLGVLLFLLPLMVSAQWKAHDMNRPRPRIITPPAQYLPILPPSDALVLFDGSGLILWEGTDGKPTRWTSGEDYFECVRGSGYIRTKEGFGDIQLHIEWAAPVPASGESQGRGNSGVFLMGLYEVQVLDSYANVTYADGQAGALYGQYPPLVNASRPPGEWQAYDIIFRRPRFSAAGELESPAVMTVFHNGVLVQDHRELWGGTEWLMFKPYKPHTDRLPLSLQDHGNPVRYRNVWVRDLETAPESEPDYAETVILPVEQLEKYCGTYQDTGKQKYKIRIENGQLMLEFTNGRLLELETVSDTKFSVKSTAIDLVFILNKAGEPESMTCYFSGGSTTAVKVKE